MQPAASLPERERVSRAASAPDMIAEDESALVADERIYEELEAQEKKDAFLEQAEASPVTTTTASTSSAVGVQGQVASVVKDEVVVELERILEDGLGDYVAAMPEEARIRFLYKGQETASRIAIMVRGFRVQAKKVVDLIRDWLLTIPGVNKFFLEQEAKIKTDRILELERGYRERGK